jgi:hypothetical protein
MALAGRNVCLAEIIYSVDLCTGLDDRINILPDLWLNLFLQGAAKDDSLVSYQCDEG